MKHTMTLKALGRSLGLLAVAAILNGCATAEKPDYQGHTGISPTVNDYYPKKAASAPNAPHGPR